ncbi:hypothetical protein [Armatimonas sp.]|uniref:hypothetical protein n=1 Tax=Armatimonas sp. TaxID=1872638 RepID=UPI003751E9F5
MTFPSVLTTSLFSEIPGWETAQQRRREARKRLQEADLQGIQEFSERLQQRQTRFWAISQALFEVQERRTSVAKAQEDRLEAERSVSEKVAMLRDDLALAQIQYQISQALASPANDTLLAPDDPVKVQAEVTRLKAAALRAEIQTDPLSGVRRAKVLWTRGSPPRNPRVLYAASRDVLKVLCDTLDAQVTQVQKDAEQKRLLRAQEREAEVQIQIAQHLEGLRSRSESFVLRLDQEESLGKILLAEELPTRRAASGSLPLTSPLTPSPSPKNTAPVKQLTSLPTNSTLITERSALEAEVRAAVLDIAQRKGILISFRPRPGVPDRTAEFANWIRVSL